MCARSIPLYPANFATFKENWIFGARFGCRWRPNAILCDMKFYAHHCFYLIAHLLCQDNQLWERGEEFCRSLIVTEPLFDFQFHQKKLWTSKVENVFEKKYMQRKCVEKKWRKKIHLKCLGRFLEACFRNVKV